MNFKVAVLALAILLVRGTTGFAGDPFLTAVGTDLRAAHGKGDVVMLRGVNLGGWLVFEPWQTPMDSGGLKDDWSARKILTERFGAERCEELLSAYQKAWISERDFDQIAAAGFNVIRLPFWFLNLQDESGAWRPQAFARLDWAVEQAWKRGIYTILDLHGAPGGQSEGDSTGRRRKKKEDGIAPDFWNNEDNLRRTTEIWQRVAEHFKGNAAVAAYDLLNEPYGAPDRETLWAVYDRLFKAVRAIDAEHVISVEGCWGGWYDGEYHGWGWQSLPPPERFGWTNVLYQQHTYEWAWNDLEKRRRQCRRGRQAPPDRAAARRPRRPADCGPCEWRERDSLHIEPSLRRIPTRLHALPCSRYLGYQRTERGNRDTAAAGDRLADGEAVLQALPQPEADGGALRSVDQHREGAGASGGLVAVVTVTRYGTRHWAVWLDGELVVVALYKKGAATVAGKLRELVSLKGGEYATAA